MAPAATGSPRRSGKRRARGIDEVHDPGRRAAQWGLVGGVRLGGALDDAVTARWLVEFDFRVEVAAAIGLAHGRLPAADADGNPSARHPLEQESVGPAPEDVRLQLRSVEVEQPAQDRDGQHAPPALLGKRP